ncbi:MAG: tetratricopeptide repeat protein [Betaproteobacteria bacterium]
MKALWLAWLLALLPAAAATAADRFQEEKIQAAFESLSIDNIGEWEKRAQAGDALAQNLMGLAHKYGSLVRQDHAVSAQWFRKAAEQGFVDAQFNLGRIYGPADGLYRKRRAAPEDYAEAAKWLGKAAAQCHTPAQVKLAELHASGGHGLDQDYVRAYFWMSRAAANGSEPARKQLTSYASRMSESQVAAAKELARAGKPLPHLFLFIGDSP